MSTDNVILNKLTSIDESLKRLVSIAELRVNAREQQNQHAPANPHYARALDLDGPYGDPLVKAKSPKDWLGDDMTGRHFSECPAEYLDLVADRLEYFAGKETDEKKRGYITMDAARARGWSARIRAGYVAPVAEPVDEHIAF